MHKQCKGPPPVVQKAHENATHCFPLILTSRGVIVP